MPPFSLTLGKTQHRFRSLAELMANSSPATAAPSSQASSGNFSKVEAISGRLISPSNCPDKSGQAVIAASRRKSTPHTQHALHHRVADSYPPILKTI